MSVQPETISVVIPTHNRERLLQRALRSVLAQTQPVDEIIVIDDGSTDGTSMRIGQEFPQVRYMRQPQCGVSAARNRGIALSSGEWIAFLDSDDEWHPHKIERQREAVTADPKSVICHCDEIWIRKGRRVNPKRRHSKAGGRIFHKCLPLCAISPSAVMIRRGLFAELGGFDESLPVCEDYDMWLRICSRHPVLFVDEALVTKYGGHADQLSTRYWGMDRFRIQALEKLLNEGDLEVEHELDVLNTLLDKIRIYVQGTRRRHKNEETARYEDKLACYQARHDELFGRKDTDGKEVLAREVRAECFFDSGPEGKP